MTTNKELNTVSLVSDDVLLKEMAKRGYTVIGNDETPSAISTKIARVIKNTGLKSSECLELFRAIKTRDEVLGGTIWTFKDIRDTLEQEYTDEYSEEMIEEIAYRMNKDVLNDYEDSEWNALEKAIKDAKITVHVTDIDWDTDGEDPEDCDLPESVDIPLESLKKTSIADYLSDEYGFCVKSYSVAGDLV